MIYSTVLYSMVKKSLAIKQWILKSVFNSRQISVAQLHIAPPFFNHVIFIHIFTIG